MDSIIFPRTGEIPLEFTGEIIFTEATDTPGKKKCSRYHQLRLARTAGGSFVAAIGFRATYDGDYDYDWAKVGTAEEIAAWIKAFDPLCVLLGFPAGKQFEEKQKRLELDIRLRFATAATRLLGELNIVEHIE